MSWLLAATFVLVLLDLLANLARLVAVLWLARRGAAGVAALTATLRELKAAFAQAPADVLREVRGTLDAAIRDRSKTDEEVEVSRGGY